MDVARRLWNRIEIAFFSDGRWSPLHPYEKKTPRYLEPSRLLNVVEWLNQSSYYRIDQDWFTILFVYPKVPYFSMSELSSIFFGSWQPLKFMLYLFIRQFNGGQDLASAAAVNWFAELCQCRPRWSNCYCYSHKKAPIIGLAKLIHYFCNKLKVFFLPFWKYCYYALIFTGFSWDHCFCSQIIRHR